MESDWKTCLPSMCVICLQNSHLNTCAAAAAAASRAVQQEEDLQASASGAVELDEFGRDANM